MLHFGGLKERFNFLPHLKIHRLRTNVQVSKIALRRDAHSRGSVNLQFDRFPFNRHFTVDYQVAVS